MIQGTSRSRRSKSMKSFPKKKKNKVTSNISKLMFVSLFAIAGVSGLNFNKSVNIQIDGVQLRVSTTANSVDKLLSENNIDKTKYQVTTDNDTISDGETILLSSEKQVELTYGGKTSVVKTRAFTLGDFFIERGIVINEEIYISNPETYHLDDFLINYKTLKVDITTNTIEQQRLEIDLPLTIVEDETLEVGKTETTQGEKRVIDVTYSIESLNGVAVKSTKTSEKVIQEGKAGVKRVGKGSPGYSSNGVDGTVVNDIGVVDFTAYAVGDGATPSTKTATGQDVATDTFYNHPTFGRIYIVAVDPSVIPLGSVVEIDGIGKAIALDTGGAIQGSRIDLLLKSPQDAINFGRQKHNVKIIQ